MSRRHERREIRLPELGEPISHYTHAVIFENLLFVSGCVGFDPTNYRFDPDVVKQARQIFVNMRMILAAAGSSFADVLKVTIYLIDMDDRPAIDPVREQFFGAYRPASTLVEVSRLARPAAKIEMDAVAGLRS